MKKYSMLIITIIMILAAAIAYTYENYNVQTPDLKAPGININSAKFGEIKNIVWLDNFTSANNALIILARKEKNGLNYSYLYYLNVDNGKSTLLSEFPSHEYLDNVILFDTPFSSSDIVTAYKNGVVRTIFDRNFNEDNVKARSEMVEIAGFAEATSMDLKGNLFYSRSSDSLIYLKQFYRTTFSVFNHNTQPNITTHFRNPYYIVNANIFNQILTYTSVKRSGIHLYSMKFDGIPASTLNLPIIKNVVSAKAIEDGNGFIGMNLIASSDSNQHLNIFMVRTNVRNDSYILDTIPFNKDMFGAIPSLDSTTYNEDYTVAYTAYDENHKGQIKVSSYHEKPRVIIEGENIFGPVRIARKQVNDQRIKVILYFTWENDGVKVKISDVEGKLLNDITHMII